MFGLTFSTTCSFGSDARRHDMTSVYVMTPDPGRVSFLQHGMGRDMLNATIRRQATGILGPSEVAS